MDAFDRRYARGPWRMFPVPALLADRKAGLRFQLGWSAALAALVVLLSLAAHASTGGHLWTSRGALLVWGHATPTLLLGVGMAVVFARGGFDLSVGAVAGLTAGVAARSGSPALALLAALGCGLLNGGLVAALRVPGWLVTGLTLFVVEAAAAPLFAERPHLVVEPDGFAWILEWRTPIALAVAAAALIWMQVRPEGAPRAGVRERLGDALPYLLTALLAGVVGLHATARVGVALPTGGGILWVDLALVVLVGGSFLGAGRANVAGAVVAALGLEALETGLVFANAPSYYWRFLQVILLVVAVALNAALHWWAARRYARRHPAQEPATPAPAPHAPPLFDRALFRGPGRLVPVPVHLSDRRTALRLELFWSAALAVLAVQFVLFVPTQERALAALPGFGDTLVPPLLLALGAALVVARGGFDFSAPQVAALAGGLAVRPGGVVLAVLVALGVGLLNGGLVALARIPGWLASWLTRLAVAFGSIVLVQFGAPAAPTALGWVPSAGVIGLGIAILGAFAWVQLGPGGAARPPSRWRERLLDGLPYVASSALACLAGLYLLHLDGGRVPLPGAETIPALILAGCWLGAGRANVIGVACAVAGLVAVQSELLDRGVTPTSVLGVMAALALVALAASRVVHLLVGRARARAGAPSFPAEAASSG